MKLSIILDFVMTGYGKAYGVKFLHRAWLVKCFYRNVRNIQAGTTALTHIILACKILSIPPQVKGDVVECGVWKGASTSSLSLICYLVHRRLIVCDSFQGLPETGLHLYLAPHQNIYGYLKEGMFNGSLSEVRANVSKYGRLEVCEFIPGMFSMLLQHLEQPVAFAFLDVDLPSSFKDCVRAIWPVLVEAGEIYVDDIGCMDVAQVFFDDVWWKENLNYSAPGVVGSGCGIPISLSSSNIGYARKLPPFNSEQWQRDPDLYYPVKI